MLQLTRHARERIATRSITDDELARALAGHVYRNPDGTFVHYDRRSRCALIVDAASDRILTVYRLTRRQVKRRFRRATRYT